MKNYRKLNVWEKGMNITFLVYEICVSLPEDEKFGLNSQMKRAAVSIPSNIAEGSSRTSDREYLRFLEIALGSLFELETQIYIAKHKIKDFNINLANELEELMNEERKMLLAFMQSIKKSITN